MIQPSYQRLIDHINGVNKELELPEVLSRYSLVQAVAKRARALVDGALPLVECKEGTKELSIAIDEMLHDKLGVYTAEPEPIVLENSDYGSMSVVDLSADYEEEE